MRGAKSDFEAVGELMEAYFEGLYQADSARLEPLFHQKAVYVNATPGEALTLSLPDYLEIVDGREAPASRGEARRDHVRSIAFGGPDLAFVHGEMSMMGRDYTDYLTLVRLEGTWRIIAKVFHFETQH